MRVGRGSRQGQEGLEPYWSEGGESAMSDAWTGARCIEETQALLENEVGFGSSLSTWEIPQPGSFPHPYSLQIDLSR